MSVNKVILLGNLGDEVKMHYFDGGGCIGRVSIATNETYKNRDGEKITDTQWHNLVFRNKLAEIAEKYLHKGNQVYVEGKFVTRKWQAEDGTDKYTTEVVVREMTMLGGKSDDKPADNKSTGGKGADKAQKAQATDEVDPEGEEDDLPF